jgi:hypothetical protein
VTGAHHYGYESATRRRCGTISGFVTNDTLNAVERGLREFLNLP